MSLDGTITLDAGATLTIVGAAPASSQTAITFTSSQTASNGEILTIGASDLDAPHEFIVPVSGFNGNDILEYRAVVTGATFNLSASNSGNETGTLVLSEGANTVASLDGFSLAPDLSGTSFIAVPLTSAPTPTT